MKLVFAIVHAKDATRCSDALSRAGFVSTRMGSSGGFLERDNVTIMVGVDEPLVDSVIGVLRSTCRPHHESLSTPAGGATGTLAPEMASLAIPLDVEVAGATVFVVDVEHYERL